MFYSIVPTISLDLIFIKEGVKHFANYTTKSVENINHALILENGL